MVVFGQQWLYSGENGSLRAKVVVLGQNGCICEKVNLIGHNWLYSGKSGAIRAEVALFRQKWL